ncbi:hypothetical protein [Saccharopolyspora hattusasensis]|uniref:hypothetical protein n=1 Tax=Saccharopolyspora hattusasensis TaxID=1128679 RepID=UPI003D9999DB
MDAVLDDPNLIGDAGLVPVVRLAERARLGELVAEAVRITDAGNSGGANPAAKVLTLVAAMCACPFMAWVELVGCVWLDLVGLIVDHCGRVRTARAACAVV